MHRCLLICIFLCLTSFVQAQFYCHESQSNLQYARLSNPDHLMFTPNLAVYYPQKLESMAVLVREMTGSVLQELEQKLDYRINGRIEIWLTEGFDGGTKPQVPIAQHQRKFPSNSGGISTVDHKRITLVYKGTESELYLDLRRSISELMVKELLYGVSVAEKVRNTAYLQFPAWFNDGLALYLAEGWTTEDDHLLRDQLLEQQKYATYRRNVPQNRPLLKSNWHFLVESRGTGTLARMVYLAKLTRSIESALYFVMNMSYSEFVKDAHIWHLQRYISEKKANLPGRLIAFPDKLNTAEISDMLLENEQTWFSVKHKNGVIIWKYHPEAGWTKVRFIASAYSVLFIRDPGEKKFYLLINDHSGYHIKSLSGTSVAVHWNTYLRGFIQLRDLVIDGDGNLWCSGYKGENHSDIYRLDVNGNEYRITNTADAESDLVLSPDRKLYWINVSLQHKAKGNEALRYSIYSFYNDSIRIRYESPGNQLNNLLLRSGSSRLSFCSDISGIINAYALDTFSSKPFALTDYSRNIFLQSEFENEVAELLQIGSHWYLSISEIAGTMAVDKLSPTLTAWKRHQEERLSHGSPSRFAIPGFPEPLQKPDKIPFYFQTDIPVNKDTVRELRTSEDKQVSRLIRAVYRPALGIQEVYTRFDNGLMGISRQNALMRPNLALRYGFGILNGGLWSDISGQRRLLLGLRIQTQLNGSDEFVQYDFRKKNQVTGASLYRSSFRNGAFLQGFERFSTLQLSGFYHHSLRDHSRLEFTISARNDRRVKLITEAEHLDQFAPADINAFLGSVHFHHLQQSATGQVQRLLKLKTESGWASTPQKQGHVFEIHLLGVEQWYAASTSRFLFRMHAGTSIGAMKTVFVSGGVPNWVNQRYRSSLGMLMEDAFSLQVVPHLRAAPQNARNGNTHVALQAEADWKVLELIFPRPLLQPIWRELRMGVFSDAGTAWYGRGPYSKENPMFITRIQAPGLDIELYQRRNPFLWSNGLQMSFPLYGYQINYSVGRMLEDNKFRPWMHSLSIGFEW